MFEEPSNPSSNKILTEELNKSHWLRNWNIYSVISLSFYTEKFMPAIRDRVLSTCPKYSESNKLRSARSAAVHSFEITLLAGINPLFSVSWRSLAYPWGEGLGPRVGGDVAAFYQQCRSTSIFYQHGHIRTYRLVISPKITDKQDWSHR